MKFYKQEINPIHNYKMQKYLRADRSTFKRHLRCKMGTSHMIQTWKREGGRDLEYQEKNEYAKFVPQGRWKLSIMYSYNAEPMQTSERYDENCGNLKILLEQPDTKLGSYLKEVLNHRKRIYQKLQLNMYSLHSNSMVFSFTECKDHYLLIVVLQILL